MAVGAQELDIVLFIVAPVAIDVMNCNGYLACNGVAFVPTTARALLAVFLDQIPTDVIRDCLICLESRYPPFFPCFDVLAALVCCLAAITTVFGSVRW